jgi:type I restriction enzyme R subunit
MWITGFDVPACSTIYLDKPMKNHTLMQTIARANRRAPGKTAGVIVDYVGVFQNLQKVAHFADCERRFHAIVSARFV